jgi:putative ABC transport system permease protein
MPAAFRELRLAFRVLRKRPSFSLVSVATLALGIGAGTMIFSVVYAVLLRPLPYRDPERLVIVTASQLERGLEGAGLALGDFFDFQRHLRSVSGLSAATTRNANWTGGEAPQAVPVALVSPELFHLLGAPAARGRTLLAHDEDPGQARAVVMSHEFWRRRFGGDPAALGKVLRLDDDAYTVVGIMPAGFAFPSAATELWLPLRAPTGAADRLSHYLEVVGSLRRGASLSQAGQEINALARQLETVYPSSNRGWSCDIRYLRESTVQRVRPALLLLFGAALLVLLIACTNVTNLFLVRAAARSYETALRIALGASEGSLFRMFLLESLVVALAGGILGVALATWGLHAALASNPRLLPLASSIQMDRSVLIFALSLVVAAGVACGAAPGLQMDRAGVQQALKDEAGASPGRSGGRFRAGLIIVESTLATILLIGAGLMLTSSAKLQRVDPGFRPEGATGIEIALPSKQYDRDSDRVQFFTQLLDRLRTYPGIRNVAAASTVPLETFGRNAQAFDLEKPNPAAPTAGVFAQFSAVTPGYFQTMGIPLLKGRDISDRDGASAPPVVIINHQMASRFFAHREPLGSRLLLTIRGSAKTAYEVVGMVGDTRIADLRTDPEPAIYAPFLQLPHSSMVVVLRAAGAEKIPAVAVQRQIAAVDANQPILKSFTLTDLIENAGARNRLFNFLFFFFGSAGLLLATLGIYGVIAYNASLRTREIAIRVALGAGVRQVLAALLGQPLKLTLIGTAVGLAAALVLVRFLASLLYGVDERDPLVFCLVAAILLATAVLAGLGASRRSLRLDTAATLRSR